VRLGHGTPQSHADAAVALVADRQGALLAHFTIFHVDFAGHADVEDDSDHVDDARLDGLFDFAQICEVEAHALNLAVFVATLHLRVISKSQTEIVLDGSEPLVGQLDLATREGVNSVLLDESIHFLGSLVEGCRLDLGSFPIHEIEVEEHAAALRVGPLAHRGLFKYSRLNDPVAGELVEHLNGHIILGRPGRLGCRGRAHLRIGSLALALLSSDWGCGFVDSHRLGVLGGGARSPRHSQVVGFGERIVLLVQQVVLRGADLTGEMLAEDGRHCPHDHNT